MSALTLVRAMVRAKRAAAKRMVCVGNTNSGTGSLAVWKLIFKFGDKNR
jgi:hypothetical protein